MGGVAPELEEFWEKKNPGNAQFFLTKRKKHAIELARQATEEGCDYLVAVGGDGTLHEVINGVCQSSTPSDAYPIIGLLPYGSANDFARSAGLTKSIESLIELIHSHSFYEIDLGKIELHNGDETRYFVNVAGIGLGPEVVKSLADSSSWLGPGFNYFRHIIKGFINYAMKEVSCTSKTWQWKGKLLQLAVANGRFFGNGICIAPDAKLTDNQLQVAVFGKLTIWDYLRNIGKLKRCRKIDHPEVNYYLSKEVLIACQTSCGIEADGEYVGVAPATIRVVPKAIKLLMPQSPNVKSGIPQ